jgi:flagellar export protein FliJ
MSASNMRPGAVHRVRSGSITPDVNGPSFRFGLERVRRVHAHGEQVAQQQLAGAMTRRDDAALELAHAEQLAGGARSATLAAAEQPQSAVELQSHQAWLERTQQARTTVGESLKRHEREVERRQAALTAAAREKKALDRLEARRRREFELAAARREARIGDEVALNVFRGSAA